MALDEALKDASVATLVVGFAIELDALMNIGTTTQAERIAGCRELLAAFTAYIEALVAKAEAEAGE